MIEDRNKTPDHPLVSICCVTYNHKNFIRDAIEGFLMQKTTFPIEIFIHDDSSTDGTTQIIKEYADKNQDLIIPILQKENQWSKGVRCMSGTFLYSKCKGKYIALCEGDDYWNVPYKLQKQVDFLEANPEYSISFHAAENLWLNTGEITIQRYECKNGFRTFNAKDAILNGGGFMTTNSMVFRTEYVKKLPDWYFKAPTGDFVTSLILSSQGKVAYFDDIMSVYRRNVPGSWSANMIGIKPVRKLTSDVEILLLAFNRYSKNKYIFPIIRKIITNRLRLIRIYMHYMKKRSNIFNRWKLTTSQRTKLTN